MNLSNYVETCSHQIMKEHDRLIQQALRKFGLDIPEGDPSKFDYTPIMNRIRREHSGQYVKWFVDDQLEAIFSGVTYDFKDNKYTGNIKYKIFEPRKV